jgi:hypothetical protein
MAWYSDKRKLAHSQTYPDRAAATADAKRAAQYGWQVEEQTSPRGPANDPLWVSGGGMSTFLAGHHQPGEVVVSYVRIEGWNAGGTGI